MIIGFDLDGIFVSKPPIIPKRLLEWLYRGPQSHRDPSYRFPSTLLEQRIRRLSHFYYLRLPMKKNIQALHSLTRTPHQFYLISSRYFFLEKLTKKLLDRYQLSPVFKNTYLNTQNLQPHLYKEELIKKLKLDLFVDDDLRLLRYLAKQCPQTQFLWYNSGKRAISLTASNLAKIKKLEEIDQYLS